MEAFGLTPDFQPSQGLILSNLSSPVDVLIWQSLQPITVLKPSFDFRRGAQVVDLTKIKKGFRQFMVGFSIFKPMPLSGLKNASTKSLKSVVQSARPYLSASESAVLFFEMAKTNNTCVLKAHDPLLSQIFVL